MIYLAILHIAAVSVCIFFLAYRFRVSSVEIMPVFTCGRVLVLYVLAMAGRLSWIDWIAVLAVVSFGIWLVSRQREQRKEFVRVCLNNMTEASFLTAEFLLIVAMLCTSDKVVTWWDDINFWATDVKALYFLDGFAKKSANVAPEFGDYPPAAQLIKWWFLHLSPHEFREGLAFAGYYVMNLVFLLPLLRGLKGRNVLVMFFMAAALWFMPSIAEVYGYDGFCADLTMACIYGSFLYAVTDIPQGECNRSSSSRGKYRKVNSEEIYYYGRLGLYLGVLVLVKSIGFVWALFGLIFMMLYQRSETVATDEHKSRGLSSVAADHHKFRGLLSVAAVASVPVLTGGSWMVFCLIMRRVTKTTATAVKYMTTDEYGISGYTREFARAFLKAFVSSPLHKEKSVVIDLTPLGLYLCICVIVILMRPLLSGWQRRIILWFTVVSGALFYGIIFVAHITIFATETQYLEAAGMISSIERYGAPFTIGTLLFLAGIWLNRGDVIFQSEKMPAFLRKYGVYLCFILFVALTAGYRVGYHGLVGYRQETEARLAERAKMIGADEAKFLETIRILKTDTGARVCYIRRGDTPRWVNNSYTAYEASPISVVYRSVNLDDAPTEWMVQETGIRHVIVVDDGSGERYEKLFAQAEAVDNCTVLHHAVNLGKGRALKTAFNHCLWLYGDVAGCVTADSDGQHTPEDILSCMRKLWENPTALILGCRDFDAPSVPARSSFGNKCTRKVFRYLLGLSVSDTQTGLRAIPAFFMKELMQVKGEWFEYETNMLIETKNLNIPITEVSVETVYIEENRTSHFNPIKDSVRIYMVFGKFLFSSISSSVLDLLLFHMF